MHVTKNVYFNEVDKLYLAHFSKFCILVEINANNHDFYGFSWFHHEKLEGSPIRNCTLNGFWQLFFVENLTTFVGNISFLDQYLSTKNEKTY